MWVRPQGYKTGQIRLVYGLNILLLLCIVLQKCIRIWYFRTKELKSFLFPDLDNHLIFQTYECTPAAKNPGYTCGVTDQYLERFQ